MTRSNATRICRTCREEKPLSEYDRYFFKGYSNGWKPVCRACCDAWQDRIEAGRPHPFTCRWCGGEFISHDSQTVGYCSRECAYNDRRDRCFERWELGDGGCWLWQGSIEPNGYGRIRVKGRRTGVHRAFYERFVGEIPEGHHVHHKCETPRCVNPQHLEALSSPEHRAQHRKFGDDAVSQIFVLKGTMSQADIARKLGVSANLVSRVLLGRPR